MSVETRCIIPAADAADIARTLKLSFPYDFTDEGGRWLRKIPQEERQNHRCVVVDGKVRAYLHIHDKQMYVGKALLRMGGIGAVATHPDFRGQGHGRTLFEDTIRFMTRAGYDVSILYGIADYYHRFGYESVMAIHSVTATQHHLPQHETTLTRGRISRRDLPEMLSLYNSVVKHRDGNCRRTKMPKHKTGFKLSDGKGRIQAYAYLSADHPMICVLEAIARNRSAARQLVGALRAHAWRAGFQLVKAEMPPRYHVTDVMMAARAMYRRSNTNRSSCMGRVIDLPRLVRKMTPEWNRLLGISRFADRRGSLDLNIGEDALNIAFGGGRLAASLSKPKPGSSVAPENFTQMLLGYRSIRDMADEGVVKVKPRDLEIVEALFPERNAFVMTLDKF